MNTDGLGACLALLPLCGGRSKHTHTILAETPLCFDRQRSKEIEVFGLALVSWIDRSDPPKPRPVVSARMHVCAHRSERGHRCGGWKKNRAMIMMTGRTPTAQPLLDSRGPSQSIEFIVHRWPGRRLSQMAPESIDAKGSIECPQMDEGHPRTSGDDRRSLTHDDVPPIPTTIQPHREQQPPWRTSSRSLTRRRRRPARPRRSRPSREFGLCVYVYRAACV